MTDSGLQTNVFNTQAGNVYLKPAGAFTRYVWGGRRMRMDEIQEPLGGVSTTTKFDARGGVQRDSLLQDVPGAITTSIVMKHEQQDRMKSELASNFWNVDKRTHVQGKDRDAPDKWVEIRRLMTGKATQRTDPATSWDAEEEGLITLPWSALDAHDIYPVNFSFGAVPALAMMIVDVHAAIKSSDVPADNLLYAITENPTAGDVTLLVNAGGGDMSEWVLKPVTGESDDPVSVLGLGDFVFVNYGTKVGRSDDRGDTFVDITLTDWATNELIALDAIDQSYILATQATGGIWASFDGARTWEELLAAGTVTSEDLTTIRISRSNPLIAWACGATNALVKTENGGFSWSSVTGPSAGKALIGMHVESETAILIMDEDGALFQSEDGGATWVAQGPLPGVSASAFTSGNISTNGADVFYIFLSKVGVEDHVFRNVESAADGYWYPVPEFDTADTSGTMNGMAAPDINVAVIVGGVADTSNLVAVVA
jgi:hypothetical protein